MKWRVLDRGVGEMFVNVKVLGIGIVGNNVKRVGLFVLGFCLGNLLVLSIV